MATGAVSALRHRGTRTGAAGVVSALSFPNAGWASPHHHGSHRALVESEPTDVDRRRAFDAIVVPTARPASYLRHAVDLARRTGRTLVVLCSGRARAEDVYEPSGSRLDLIAVDVKPGYRLPLVDLATSDSPHARFARNYDTSLKRNIGLLLARMVGWNRILFLDDDIAVPDHADLGRAAALLDDVDTVGLSLGGYPDNSVVCHAHRIAGGNQDTFVGGGAMAVAASRTSSFFPDIYNEDWFFLLDNLRMRPVRLIGQALQREYDPFASANRARSEEFGDTVAEGIFWLLDQDRRLKDATNNYWDTFLTKRRLFIADVIRRTRHHDGIDPIQRRRMLDALTAAAERSGQITPEACASYLRDWRNDRSRWQRAIKDLPCGLTHDEALAHLGLGAAQGSRPYAYPDSPHYTASAVALPPSRSAVPGMGAGCSVGARTFPSLRDLPARSDAASS